MYTVCKSTHACACVCLCDRDESFTVVEPPNPGLSMSSSRAHRNSVVQSCSHSCYSRGWWPPKSQNAEREGSSLRSVSQWPGGPQPGNKVRHGGDPSSGTSACCTTPEFFLVGSQYESLHRCLALTSEGSWMFLERLREDISTAQKAFPFRLARILWKWQNSLCANWRCTKIAIVSDTFLAAVVYFKACSPKLNFRCLSLWNL